MLNILKRLKRYLQVKRENSFLIKASGVIHIGANSGQERDLYAMYRVKVIWVEPIPEIFKKLQDNIEGYNGQFAVNELITNEDGKEYKLNIASNDGASSSIYEFKHHKDIWPDIEYVSTINMRGITLCSLIEKFNINLEDYDVLVMDTQGSEYLILKGAIPVLNRFKFIKLEAADFESYLGSHQLTDIASFMQENGFVEYRRYQFAKRGGSGGYYDVIYKNTKVR